MATNNVVDEVADSLEGIGARQVQAISAWVERTSITLHGAKDDGSSGDKDAIAQHGRG